MFQSRTISFAFLALFVASGCSALIYEVVWFQQLGLSLGATAISLAILLSSFMGGMCLGSWTYSKLIPVTWHPLKVYAALEALIAVCGLATLWAIPALSHLYSSYSAPGASDLGLRATLALIILLPPTILMGATLPAASRALATTREGLSRLGAFYTANTLGAVCGCLASGLYLLPRHDVAVATSVAAALNLLVAAVAFRLASRVAYEAPQSVVESNPETAPAAEPVSITPLALVAVVIGISGATALGSEVIWTRLMALLFGPTVYTFSLILAVFLLGLTVGSGVGSYLSRRLREPGIGLAITQILLALAIPYAAWMVIHVLPGWCGPGVAAMSGGGAFGHGEVIGAEDSPNLITQKAGGDFLRALAILFPATCLWGASFPLAVAAAAGRARDNARLVGSLYAANTLGAIAGALLISLFGVPKLGSQISVQVLTLLAAAGGLMLLAAAAWRQFSAGRQPRLAAAALLLTAVMAPYLVRVVPAVPPGMLAWGRMVSEWPKWDYPFVAEGIDSPIAISVSHERSWLRCFHVAGKVEATNSVGDMRTQRFLGHLPAMAHGGPKRVLVIGCGSGMTAGAFLLHPSVEKVTICEIEREVVNASRENFAKQNYGVLKDPRTEIVIDDGRHFLATTKEKFDVISADPIHPWVRGAASLYTEEFYKLCREHLNPGGVVTQWVPLYESSEAAVKSELATLMRVFPHTSIWSGQGQNFGYDVVVLGTMEPGRLNPQSLAIELNFNEEVQASLGEVGYGDPVLLLKTFTSHGADLKEWLADAQINRDKNLRLQYLAGLTQSASSGPRILSSLKVHRHPPLAKGALRVAPLSN